MRYLQHKAAVLDERVGGVLLEVVNAECMRSSRQRHGADLAAEAVRS